MGQAKNRGTFEQRRARAIERENAKRREWYEARLGRRRITNRSATLAAIGGVIAVSSQ